MSEAKGSAWPRFVEFEGAYTGVSMFVNPALVIGVKDAHNGCTRICFPNEVEWIVEGTPEIVVADLEGRGPR